MEALIKELHQEAKDQTNDAERSRIANSPAFETATLRDLFAGFALAGIIANRASIAMEVDAVAHGAYSFADAMLEQRSEVE